MIYSLSGGAADPPRMLQDGQLLATRLRFRVFQFFAANRTVLVATLSAAASAFLGLWLQSSRRWLWLCLFLVAQLFLVLVGTAPIQYATSALVESILPSIHKILGLSDYDRIAVHHIRSKRRQQYQQITHYYETHTGRGRVFPFAHGIVGQCFKVPQARSYAVPPGVDFRTAMRERWDFSDDELSRVRQDRRSFFAFPVGRHGELAKAVLYMDSPDPSTFADEKRDQIAQKIRDLFLPQLEGVLSSP